MAYQKTFRRWHLLSVAGARTPVLTGSSTASVKAHAMFRLPTKRSATLFSAPVLMSLWTILAMATPTLNAMRMLRPTCVVRTAATVCSRGLLRICPTTIPAGVYLTSELLKATLLLRDSALVTRWVHVMVNATAVKATLLMTLLPGVLQSLCADVPLSLSQS